MEITVPVTEKFAANVTAAAATIATLQRTKLWEERPTKWFFGLLNGVDTIVHWDLVKQVDKSRYCFTFDWDNNGRFITCTNNLGDIVKTFDQALTLGAKEITLSKPDEISAYKELSK